MPVPDNGALQQKPPRLALPMTDSRHAANRGIEVANHGRCCPRKRISSHPDLPPCAGCGRCCHLVVELRIGDVVPEHYVVEHAGARCMDQRGDGACVALDPVTSLCTIYAGRPQTCRELNRGETLCRRILAAGRNLTNVGLSQLDSPAAPAS